MPPLRTMFLLVSICLALLAGLIGTIVGFSMSGYMLLAFPAVAVLGYALFRLARYLLARLDSKDLFSPLVAFPIVYVIWFTVGSINLLDVPSSFSFGAFDPIPRRMWFFYGIGLLSYMAGAATLLRRKDKLPSGFLFTWQTERSAVSTAVLVVVMCGSYLAIVSQIGVPVLRSAPGMVRLQIGEHMWAQLFLMAGAYTLLPFLPAYLWTRIPGQGTSAMLWVLTLLAATLLMSLGGRGFLFEPLLTAIVARHYLKRKYSMLRLGSVLLLLFATMSVYGYLRDDGEFESDSPIVRAGFPSALFPFAYAYLYVRYTVATFRDVVSVVPSQFPYQHGWMTLQPLQGLLPGHHKSSDFFFKLILGNDFEGAGQPATLLGPFYGDFGVVGIVLGMFAFGVLCAGVYRWMLRERTVTSVLIYSWLVHIAIWSLFLSVFQFPTYLWIPVMWLTMDWFLRSSRNRDPFVSAQSRLSPGLPRDGE